MMIHAMIIGQTDDLEDENEEIAAAVSAVKNSGTHVRRARNTVEFFDAVADVRNSAGLIDLLDIIDHGRPGQQNIGSDVLFGSTGDYCKPLHGTVAAAALSGFLAPFAHVRLLGCRTGSDGDGSNASTDAGRALLFKLGRALGRHRVVFGTMIGTTAAHFSELGYFAPGMEGESLFSSLAAVDGEAPTYSARQISYGLLLGQRC